MKTRLLAMLVSGVFFNGLASADAPTLGQLLGGSAGAALGGVVGNQVGKGTGKTVTTAVGAGVGAAIGSGCKFSVGTVIGGTVGGLLGAQVGGGNGKNAMAGVGAAAGTLIGSDCGDQEEAGPHKPQVGRVVRMNSITLTEVSPAEWPMGNFVGFPRIQRKSDFDELDRLTKSYAQAQWEAAGRQDWEAFAVNRRLGERLVEFRLQHKVAATSFVNSVTQSRDGTGTLAPGATVFLPAFSRWGQSGGQTAMREDVARELFAANGMGAEFGGIDWAAAPKVADAGGLSGLTGLLKGASSLLGGKPNGAQQAQASAALAQLPVGAVFSAHDERGNTFLVERTPEGFNVGNPGQRPVDVKLGELGFIPDMPMPDLNRQKVAPILLNMVAAGMNVGWDQIQNKGALNVTVTAPNVIVSDLMTVAYLDANGNLTTDQGEIAKAKQRYQVDSIYRDAIRLADVNMNSDRGFKEACGKVGNSIYSNGYGGEFAELQRHSCYTKSRVLLNSKTYYVFDGKRKQTYASLMQDRAVADRLRQADNEGQLLEAMLGFVPGVGNVDSAAKCLTGTSFTARINDFARADSGKRAFVDDLIPAAEEESTLMKAATCAAALPVVGTAAKGVSKAGRWTGVYREWAATDRAQEVFKSLEFFETNPSALKGDAVAMLSGDSMARVKAFYDGLQIGVGGSQVKESGGAVLSDLLK